MSDDVADVLERAADLLWVRGRAVGMGEYEGRLCVLGAIAEAKGGSAAHWVLHVGDDEEMAVGRYLYLHPECISAASLGVHPLSDYAADRAYLVTCWNDGMEDDELVIDTMRRCAKAVRDAA